MHNKNINHKKHLYGLNLRRSSSFFRVINLKMASVLSFVILALLFLAIIAPVHFKTELAEAAPGTPTASTLSFTGTNLVASATLTVNSPTGSFATSGENEKSSFSISTNNYTGYILTLRSSGTNTSLSDGGSHIISTLPASTTQAVFSASDTTGQVLNNRWGYIPSYYNSVANTTTYYPAPTSVNTATLRATSSANSVDGTSNADNYTIGLGFRADYNSPSGTYANDTFVLEYVANPIVYNISFADDTGDTTVEGLPDTIASGTDQTSVTLPSTIPTRAKYVFSNWCFGTVSDNGTTCGGTPGTEFGAGDSFGIDQTIENTITLYAVWDPVTFDIAYANAGKSKSGDYYLMQDMTEGICSNVSTGQTTTLTDSRNGGTNYTVAKIGDYCIMTKNLALSGTIQASGSNFFGSDITPEYTSYTYLANSYIGNKVLITNATYGAYYNYCMATAGTICSTAQVDATSDICPANWKMPSYAAYTLIRSATDAASLFSTQVGGGYLRSNSASPTGTSYGYYWSSTANNTTSYTLRGTATALTTTTNYRYYGQTIRCINSPNTADRSLTVNFSGTGVTSVKICKTSGDCSGNDLVGTISSNERSVTGLRTDFTYYLYPTFSNGYAIESWQKNSSTGVLSSNNESNPTFTLGPSDGEVTIAGATARSLTIDFAGTGVLSVDICADSDITSCILIGDGIKGTVSTSGDSVSGLAEGATYYLIPTFSSGYGLENWNKTSSYGVLSSTTDTNPTFTMGAGDGAVTITGKPKTYSLAITFAGSGVSSVKVCRVTGDCSGSDLMGTVTSSGSSVSNLVYNNTYYLYPSYTSGAVFGGWKKTSSYGALEGVTATNTTTSVPNPSFTMTAGNGAVRIISATDEMQNLSLSSCTTSGTYVYDNRDNSVYLVKKLADNKCWLLDNLRLDLTNSTIVNGLTVANTNATSTSLTSLRSGNRTNGSRYATSGLTLSNWTSGASYSSPMVDVTYKDTVAPTTYGDGSGKIGVYYNYCAASAGSHCYGSETSSGYYYGVADAIEDICPRGWRMPTSGSSSEYQALYGTYSSNNYNYRVALSTPFSGIHDADDGVRLQGSSGSFWSSSEWKTGTAGMLALYVASSSTNFTGISIRNEGVSVRCILDPEYYTVTVTAGSGVSSVSINGGPASSTVSETFRPGSNITISATNSTGNISTWSVSGTGTLETTTTPVYDTQASNTFVVGSSASTITVTAGNATTEMQNLDPSLCTAAGNYVYDSRDSSVYLVRKLADNRCWMLDNLRLDLTNSTVVNALTTSNTNASAASLTSLKSGYRNRGDQYATSGLSLSNWMSDYSYSDPLVNSQYKNEIVKRYGDGSGRIGVYYNYCAASAGSYCYGNGSSYGTSVGDATEDICPKGWHLPSGTNSGEYRALYEAYSSNGANFRAAFSASLSGILSASLLSDVQVNNRDSYGEFWTSTVYSIYGRMYRLSLAESVTAPDSYINRYYGLSVRCVLDL